MRHNDPVGLTTALVAVLTLPLGLLTGLFVSLQAAVAVFVVGWLLLVPLLPIVGNEILGIDEPELAFSEPADSLDRLKQQYVDGELDEDEFDRKVARLVDPTPGPERGGRARSDDEIDSDITERALE
ncbi:SHOCT domain-containing protein [Halosolutus gelatinilyticus]|uniref:SHOCT domain-containing protein n=1 Tax=Halosolutus gelatinilyticus TaxID=2931975 RepID=UPI001FF4CED0|nr:SHOCT domain-containing protein [Halosolutus gelatinilyticus]